MNNRKFGSLSSSINPQELSLTVESIGKVLGSLLILYASIKGIDPKTVTEWYQPLVAQAGVVISSTYGAYNAILAFWGLVRKGIAYFTA